MGGYAIAHYHALPFGLVDATPLRIRSAGARGRRLRGVEVELPPGLRTHCRVQAFFFDDDGLLVRHNYVAEVVGAWARGAHFWSDFVEVAGLQVARMRRVAGRLGLAATPVVALQTALGEVAAIEEAPPPDARAGAAA